MDEDSYILTADLSDWSNLLGTLVGLNYFSLGVWFKLFYYSAGIGIYDVPAGLLLGSELRLSLGDLLYYETWPAVGLKLFLDIPPESKGKQPELVRSPS